MSGTAENGDPYGVSNDGSDNLSGYAWSTSAGWINFHPSHGGGVIINTSNGSFDGYAWGENIGWIHFKNTDPAYNVVTTFYPTVVTLARFVARSAGGGNGLVLPLALVALGALGATLLLRSRRG